MPGDKMLLSVIVLQMSTTEGNNTCYSIVLPTFMYTRSAPCAPPPLARMGALGGADICEH